MVFVGTTGKQDTANGPTILFAVLGNVCRHVCRHVDMWTCVCVGVSMRRTTSSTSTDCEKHTVYEYSCQHEMQGGKIFAPQTIFRNLLVTTSCFLEMKNVSTFGSNEYVGKQGTVDSVVQLCADVCVCQGSSLTTCSSQL